MLEIICLYFFNFQDPRFEHCIAGWRQPNQESTFALYSTLYSTDLVAPRACLALLTALAVARSVEALFLIIVPRYLIWLTVLIGLPSIMKAFFSIFLILPDALHTRIDYFSTLTFNPILLKYLFYILVYFGQHLRYQCVSYLHKTAWKLDGACMVTRWSSLPNWFLFVMYYIIYS